jgi:DNA-binding transcriptional MerR regulator
MSYKVSEIAKITGVSVRTLHFYDEIGLLKPASTSSRGYRIYEDEQLLLLQQILIYREMGMPLSEIQSIVHGDDFDVLVALKVHRKVLADQMLDKQKLLRTVDNTIESLEGNNRLTMEQLFADYDWQKQDEYEAEIIDRGGEQATDLVATSKRRMQQWKAEDFQSVKDEFEQLHQAFAQSLQQGIEVDHESVMALTRRHYLLINKFYSPTREVYRGLGRLYVEHPDFRKLYDAFDVNLAEYLKNAMDVFVESEMKE